MAGFQWAGDLTGAAPVIRTMQVAANCYVGQLLREDANAGGLVEPIAAAAAGPDTTSNIIGICTGVVTSPTWDSTYLGDLATYDTTQATLVANDPKGPALVEVTLLTPTSLIKGPVCKDTLGTAPERKACTTGSSDGLTFVVAAIDTTVSNYSTAYCSKGANRGQYRKITTGATTTQTVLVPFTYDIATGDTFVIVNIREGFAHIDFGTQFQSIDSSPALTSYYYAYVHELNLDLAGKEYAVFSLGSSHLAIGR
uniref:Uncharacterized protein n=1 Tax=viral metagenome TaxID=1070528 RepID=A0A6M3K612_9ZZZZ